SYVLRPATTLTSSLSLHDALPISLDHENFRHRLISSGVAFLDHEIWIDRIPPVALNGKIALAHEISIPPKHFWVAVYEQRDVLLDRKSTRLNSSHEWISYAVFCLK